MITTYEDSFNNLKVYSKQGYALAGNLDGFFEYKPIGSLLDLQSEAPFDKIILHTLDSEGDELSLNRAITDMGVGKISALMEMRDMKLPNLLAQLDILAKTIKEEFNKIHNEGVAPIAPLELVGTNVVSRDTELAFTGNIRVAIIDDKGQPIQNIPSVKINLSNLDTGLGAGKANLQGIMDEIAYNFGDKLSVDKSVQVGGLHDIRLVPLTKNIVPAGQITLALELENLSLTDNSFEILGVTATDHSGANILSSFNGAIFNAAASSTSKTTVSGPSIVINTPASEYPYTIGVQVRVNDGTPHTATINYIINDPYQDPFNGILNHRFAALSATGSATLTAPPLASDVLEVSLIDAYGSSIAGNSNAPGRLKIHSTSKNYHIAIDNMDSIQTGDIGNNIIGTRHPFSYYMGLNDLFVRMDEPSNWGNTRNTAYNIKVRDDIALNANKISSSTLTEIIDLSNPTIRTNLYEVSVGNFSNLNNFSTLIDKTFYFPLTGGSPATTINLTGYSMGIIAYETLENQNIQSSARSDLLMKDGLMQRLQNIRGVDVNQEMANLIITQQYFQSNVKAMTISKELFEVLINSF